MSDRERPAALAARSGTHRRRPDHPVPGLGGRAPRRARRRRLCRRCTAGRSTNSTPSGQPSPSGSTSASRRPTTRVLADRSMPGAQWFPGATLNYAEHALRAAADPAARRARAAACRRDPRDRAPSAGPSCAARSAPSPPSCARLGVRPGDRVSGYLPNVPQAVVALLATAAVGGVWTSCAPDFGARSVLDRFQQVEPVVLFTVDGYRYGGKAHDRRETVAELRRELPTLRAVVHIPLLGTEAPEGALDWADLTAARHRTGLRTGRPSTTPCGCSTPRAPPACPRPSSSPRAASCSSTSSSSACTATSAPATASSGTPPPAG